MENIAADNLPTEHLTREYAGAFRRMLRAKILRQLPKKLGLGDRLFIWSPKRPAEGCWEWRGNFDRHGYGIVWWKNQPLRAHRAAWILSNGDPGEKHVCHRCDNPACIRPSHLFLGDALENARDRERKGRGRRPIKKRKDWVPPAA